MQNPAGVEEAVAWLGLARLLGIRFLVSERLLHSFLSLPLPLFCFVFILSQGGEKNKTETRLEFQTIALKGRKSWMQSGWAGVLILALLLEMQSHAEKMVLWDMDAQRRWFAFLFPLAYSLQERGVILFRVE